MGCKAIVQKPVDLLLNAGSAGNFKTLDAACDLLRSSGRLQSWGLPFVWYSRLRSILCGRRYCLFVRTLKPTSFEI